MSTSGFLFKGQFYSPDRLAEMERQTLLDLRNEIQAEVDLVRGVIAEMKRKAKSTGQYEHRDTLRAAENMQRTLGRGMMLIQAAFTKIKFAEKTRNIEECARRKDEEWTLEEKKVFRLAELVFAASVDASATMEIDPDDAHAVHRDIAQESIYAAETFLDVFDEWVTSSDDDGGIDR